MKYFLDIDILTNCFQLVQGFPLSMNQGCARCVMGVLYTVYADSTTSASFGGCGGIPTRIPTVLQGTARLLTVAVCNMVQICCACCAMRSVVHVDELTARFTQSVCMQWSLPSCHDDRVTAQRLLGGEKELTWGAEGRRGYITNESELEERLKRFRRLGRATC